MGDESIYVWVEDRTWIPLKDPKPCRAREDYHHDCRFPGYFALLRGNGPWAYCEEHMYGRRVMDGKVWIKVQVNSKAGRQGYFT